MVNDEAPQSSVSHLVELQQKEEKKRKDYALFCKTKTSGIEDKRCALEYWDPLFKHSH